MQHTQNSGRDQAWLLRWLILLAVIALLLAIVIPNYLDWRTRPVHAGALCGFQQSGRGT